MQNLQINYNIANVRLQKNQLQCHSPLASILALAIINMYKACSK